MKRVYFIFLRYYLTVLIIAPWLTSCSFQSNEPKEKELPNVIIIVADDMGWGDTGYNGNKIQKTPALDQMAGRGVRFDRFYAASTVCAPTRASIVTGQNGARLGISHWGSSHVADNDVLVSELLKEKGYATGHFGKWHLGLLDKGDKDYVAGPRKPETDFSPPWINGFDVCFSTENVVPTWDPMLLPDKGDWGMKKREETGLWGNNYWNHKGEMIAHDDNLSGDDSRVIMDRVIPFVEENANQAHPFFAYICFHAPHTPTISGGKYLDMYEGEEGKHHYGAITAMDEQIGRLINTLKKTGQEKNTLIWFIADNGAAKHNIKLSEYGGYGSNKPFRGWKGELYEGGIRIPSVLLYPSAFPKPIVVSMPCVTSDMLPTIMHLIGDTCYKVNQPQDGMDIYDAIRGTQITRNTPIGFAYSKNAVWMTQTYKLITTTMDGQLTDVQLYDISTDPYEKKNIADYQLEIVSRMTDSLIMWLNSCNQSCGNRFEHLPVPERD